MNTYMAKCESVDRKWYVIDAAGIPMGRVAAKAAVLLRGKHKPTFTPHVDCGDYVIVINTDKMLLTGAKGEQKFYRTHSGYAGGLKETPYRILMATRSDFAMKLAVKGMIPATAIGRTALARLKTFKGAEHTHAAQKPEIATID